LSEIEIPGRSSPLRIFSIQIFVSAPKPNFRFLGLYGVANKDVESAFGRIIIASRGISAGARRLLKKKG